MSNIDHLRESYESARKKLSSVQKSIQKLHSAIKDKYDQMAYDECRKVDDDYADTLAELVVEMDAANRKYQDMLVEQAKAKTLGGVPVGGRVVEWISQYRFSSIRKQSGKIGIVEVCTIESRFSDNVVHGIPTVGKLFVRILKKDGTPSRNFANGRWSLDGGDDKLPWGWYPEGVDPNKER